MFSFFRKKSELERLTEQYQSLLEASFKLSTTDRKASDLKRAEAEALVPRMDELRSAQN
ncbi:MAG: Lacal_2735 family protein [Bacteroidetes bacterium]|jgi:prefoldin subunit 5|nr:Lacal_2735 family protein [Bacteroidota bacterium]